MPRAAQTFRKAKPFQVPTKQPVKKEPTPQPEPKPEEVVYETVEYERRPPSVPSEAMTSMQEYNEQLIKSQMFYKFIGYEKYAGQYEPFTIPEGYKITSIEETPTGLSVQFEQKQQPVAAQATPEGYMKAGGKAKLPSLFFSPTTSIQQSPLGKAVADIKTGIKKKAFDPRTDPTSLEVQIFKPIFEAAEGVEEFKARETAKFERDPLGYTAGKTLEVTGVIALAINPPAALVSMGIGAGIQTGLSLATTQRLPTVDEATTTMWQSAGFSLVAGKVLKGAAAIPKIGKYAATRLGKTAIMSGIGGTTGYVYSGGDVIEAAKSAALAGGITFGLETAFPTKPDTMLSLRQQRWAERAAKDFPDIIDLSSFYPELRGIAPEKAAAIKKAPLRTVPSLQEAQSIQDELLGLRQGKWAVRATKQQLSISSLPSAVVDVSDDLLAMRQQKWAVRTMKYQLSLESILKSKIPELPKSMGEYLQPIKKTGYGGGKVVQSGKQALIQIQKEVQQQKPITEIAKAVTETKSTITALTLRQRSSQKIMQRQKRKRSLLEGVGVVTAQINKVAQMLEQPQKQKQTPAQAAAQAQKLAQPLIPVQAQPQVPAQKTQQASKLAVPTLQIQITKQIQRKPPKKTKTKMKKKKTIEDLWAKQSLRYIPLRKFTAFSGLKKSLKEVEVKGVASHILDKKRSRNR